MTRKMDISPTMADLRHMYRSIRPELVLIAMYNVKVNDPQLLYGADPFKKQFEIATVAHHMALVTGLPGEIPRDKLAQILAIVFQNPSIDFELSYKDGYYTPDMDFGYCPFIAEALEAMLERGDTSYIYRELTS